jgi:predicted metal-dependent hydrolase
VCQNKVVVDSSSENSEKNRENTAIQENYVKSLVGQLSNLQNFQNQALDQTLPGIDEGEIVVIRSKKRKRSISAFRQGGKIIISIPARLTKAEEREVVPEMIAKIRAKEVAPDETELSKEIDRLLSKYAPEITIRPASVAWRSMNERWGSCTSVDRTIRIATKLQRAPKYVLDFVLYHEAIHLYIYDHGSEFQEFLKRYPRHLEAEAFLEGYELAEQQN